ncbi:hypothetical protein Ancab_039071 [Ancistrocladus abbreviatus]
MANQSIDAAVERLKKLLSEMKGLEEVAAQKIDQLTDGLRRPDPMPFDPVVGRLRDGFMKFKHDMFDKLPCIFEKLKEGQSPKFLVFACSDSRVSPSHILSFLPGEAFMARSIANLVPEFGDKGRNLSSGAIIEYAVTALEVENILVIGHSRCGGIKRLMTMPEDGSDSYDFIDDWVKIASSAKKKVIAEHMHEPLDVQLMICEIEAVKLSLENVKEYPYVKERLEKKSLRLWGGYYDFLEGKFSLWLMGGSPKPIVFPSSEH